MATRLLGLSLALAITWLTPLAAEDSLPSLDSVKWAGTAPSSQTLRGKTVVLLVYATWCPKCNKWSGDLFKQLKDAVKDKPVVLLSINADKSPTAVKTYVTQRDFFAPNILHGYDPSIVQRLKLDSDLFKYIAFGPDGKLVNSGNAGSFINDGQRQNFVIANELAKNEKLGRFDILDPEMSDALKEAVWPMELGEVSEKALADSQKKLTATERKALNAALTKCLNAKLKRIETLTEGDTEDQFEAYEQASALSAGFKSKQQGKQAKELLVALSKDKDFQRELAAKKNYDKTMQIIAAKPTRREQLLQTFCKRFEGTHYAGVAKENMAQSTASVPKDEKKE